jgi:putative oxidoreductase
MDHVVGRKGERGTVPVHERLDELLAGKKEIFLDLIRMYLGLGLVVKGILFLADKEYIGNLVLEGGGFDASTAMLAHYIPMAHISGGALMLVGLGTRVGAIIQIPILFGAVFLVHLREGLFTRNQSLEFAALVLFLLVVYAIVGSGPISLDRRLARK